MFFIISLFYYAHLSGCSTPVGSITPAEVGEEPAKLYTPKPVAGSLWPSEADKNGLFSDSKASRVGDIVTITILETASATKEASTDTAKDSEQALSMSRMFGLGTNMGITDFLGSGKPFDPRLATNNSNTFSGSGTTSRSDNLTATMTAVIKEVLPSGNFRIEGRRMVTVNNEKQTLILTGTIRPVDIQYTNIVSSELIANAEITYTGRGVLSDKQRVGWGTRILDHIWPF